jgi:hypothetical protein
MRELIVYGIAPLVVLNIILLVIIAIGERKQGRLEGKLEMYEQIIAEGKTLAFKQRGGADA